MLCDCRLWFRFLSVSFLFMPNPSLYTPMYIFSLPNSNLSLYNFLLSSPIVSYGFVPLYIILPIRWAGGSGAKPEIWVDSNGWVCVGVSDAILAQNIHCNKPNTKPDVQSGSQFWKGFRDISPHINLEYNLATAISIRTLTQPVMCEMGLSSFVAMSWLKVASTTGAYLPIIPSTEKKSNKNVSVGRNRSAHVCTYWFSPNPPTTYTF